MTVISTALVVGADLSLEDEISALAAKLPRASRSICDTCRGEGRHSRSMGSFTCDDLAELGCEWQDDYFSGRFDRQCEDCNGAGKVKDIDYDRAEAEMPDALAAYCEKSNFLAQIDGEISAEYAAERRMGC